MIMYCIKLCFFQIKALNDSSAMSQHKHTRDKDSRGKKTSNGVSPRQSSGENKNIEIKYTKVLEDGGGKRKTCTTHQETMTDPTLDVVAASR